MAERPVHTIHQPLLVHRPSRYVSDPQDVSVPAYITTEYDAATGLVNIGGHSVSLESLDYIVTNIKAFRVRWQELREEASQDGGGDG